MKFGYTIAGFEGFNTPVESGINYAKNDLESIQATLDAETYEIAMFESLSDFKKYEIESTILSDFSTGLEAEDSTDKPWYKKLWEKIKAMFKAIGEFFMNFFRWIGRKLGIIKSGIKNRVIVFMAKHVWAKKVINFILRRKETGMSSQDTLELQNEFSEENIVRAVDQTEGEIKADLEKTRKISESGFSGYESVETGFEAENGVFGTIGKYLKELKNMVVEYVLKMWRRYSTPDELKRATGAMSIATQMSILSAERIALIKDISKIIKNQADRSSNLRSGTMMNLMVNGGFYMGMLAGMQGDKSSKDDSDLISKSNANEAVEIFISVAKRVTSKSDDSMFKATFNKVNTGEKSIYELYKESNFEDIVSFLNEFTEIVDTFSKNFEATYKDMKVVLDNPSGATNDFLKGFLEGYDEKERLEKAREVLSLISLTGTKLSTISKKLIAAVGEIENYIKDEDNKSLN